MDITYALILTGVIATLLVFPFYRHSEVLRPLDEGFYAYPAWLILQGKKPYKDFYLGYTPAKTYLLASIFRLFGAKLSVARIYYATVTVILTVEIVLLSYLIVPSTPLAFSMGILFVIALFPREDIYYITAIETGLFCDRTAWALAFMATLIIASRSGSLVLHAISGILLGITLLWGQEMGIAGLFAGIVFILLNRANLLLNLSVFLTGFLSIVALAVTLLYVNKIPVGRIWTEAFCELLFTKETFDCRRSYPSPIPCLPERYSLNGIRFFFDRRFVYFIHYSRYYLPLLIHSSALTFFMIELWSEGTLLDPVMLPISFGIYSALFLYTHPDYSHIVRGLPFQLPATAYLINKIFLYIGTDIGGSRIFSIVLVYLLILLLSLATYDLLCSVKTICSKWHENDVTLLQNNGIFVQNKAYEKLDAIKKFLFLNSNPYDKILVLPTDPLIYFLTRRHSPIYIISFFPNRLPYYQRLAEKEMEKETVKWLIYNNSQDRNGYFPGNITFSEYAPTLSEYITNHYELHTTIANYDILKRRMV